jgi:hypothetical protein
VHRFQLDALLLGDLGQSLACVQLGKELVRSQPQGLGCSDVDFERVSLASLVPHRCRHVSARHEHNR